MQAFRQAAAATLAAAAREGATSGQGSAFQGSEALVHGQPLERVVRTLSRPLVPGSEAGSGPQTTEDWLADWRAAAALQAAQMREQQLRRWGLL